jgi:hypothetical protein
MSYRNIDTQGIGERGIDEAKRTIGKLGHYFIPIDGSIDKAIDGYIRLRKKVKYKDDKDRKVLDFIETGNIVGVQVKTVSQIPKTGSKSYYINKANKEVFGVNFNNKNKLDKAKSIWSNFIGPVILIFVDLETEKCWWTDLNDTNSFIENDYSVTVKKENILNEKAFISIKKIGKELFVKKEIPLIKSKNYHFFNLKLTNFKESSWDVYQSLKDENHEFYSKTINPKLGLIHYSKSGWKHITRLNRRKMRIINSLLLLKISKEIIENVESFSKVKNGLVRESKKFIKKVDFLTLRANVEFNFRQDSIVQVVLRRVKIYDKLNPENKIEDKIYFHSVYEPYRKEN